MEDPGRPLDQHSLSKSAQQPKLVWQSNLANARVLVVGAGALGCFLLQQLAVAGVGFIGLADGGKIERTGLHQPVLFATTDIGELKVKVAANVLRQLHTKVVVKEYPFFLYHVLAMKIIPKYDIVVDCTNNLAARYLLNDACDLLKKPMIFGALQIGQGYVGLLHVGAGDGHRGINYRDLAAHLPKQPDGQTELEPQLKSALDGIVAGLQATAAVRWITGSEQLFQNCMVVYEIQSATQKFVPVQPSEETNEPISEHDFLHTNYEWLLGGGEVKEIGMRELQRAMASGVRFVDVRELHEVPALLVPHQKIPLSRLRQEKVQVEGEEVIVVCHLGVRSVEAVRLLSQWAPPGQKLYSLKGGIMTLAAMV